LTLASVKFELLSRSPQQTVSIATEDGGSCDVKIGSFVMYNCSRIATLLNNFNKSVELGKSKLRGHCVDHVLHCRKFSAIATTHGYNKVVSLYTFHVEGSCKESRGLSCSQELSIHPTKTGFCFEVAIVLNNHRCRWSAVTLRFAN